MLPLLVATLCATVGFGAAHAAQWDQAGMKSLGFVFDLPPEFAPTSQTNENATFFAGPSGASLAVGGGPLDEGGFRATIRNNMDADRAEGWNITYERLTGGWASYSGIRDGQIRYVRAIPLCKNRIAVFVLDYSRAEKTAYDPVVVRMVRSLRSTDC